MFGRRAAKRSGARKYNITVPAARAPPMLWHKTDSAVATLIFEGVTTALQRRLQH